MAYLWFQKENSWSAMPLNGLAVDISVGPPRVLADGFQIGEDTPAAVIGADSADARVWVLLTGADGDVRVNGFRPIAGIRVLRDRDEIRFGAGGPLFFSAETLASVEEFPGSDRVVYCGRCRLPMENGQTAVQCPHCKIWHHQTDGLPCWTYAQACSYCPQATSLEAAGFEWVPED